MSKSRKPFVFLSYSTIDRDVISKISQFLEAHGVVVWFNSKVILPGQPIVDEIDRAIAKSDFMISFFSRASI
jgi:hypothetical protein